MSRPTNGPGLSTTRPIPVIPTRPNDYGRCPTCPTRPARSHALLFLAITCVAVAVAVVGTAYYVAGSCS